MHRPHVVDEIVTGDGIALCPWGVCRQRIPVVVGLHNAAHVAGDAAFVAAVCLPDDVASGTERYIDCSIRASGAVRDSMHHIRVGDPAGARVVTTAAILARWF